MSNDTKPKIGTTWNAVARKLDDNGCADGEVRVMTAPDGTFKPMAYAPRSAYLDWEQMLEEIRDVVREEIANGYMRFKRIAEMAAAEALGEAHS